ADCRSGFRRNAGGAGRDRSRGRAAWPMPPDGLQARPPKCLAICLRRSYCLRRTGQPNEACPRLGRQPSMDARPGLHRAPIGPYQDGIYLPLAASHFSLVMAEKPWPLQAFWPLQEFAPPLQALWPLQALTPTHLPSPAAWATVVMVAPARNRVAAAAAIVAPDFEVTFMRISSRGLPRMHRIRTATL